MLNKDKTIGYCDKIMEVSLYILIFCLPFSRAMIEICASLAIVAWLVKKSLVPNFGLKPFRLFPSTYLNWPVFALLAVSLITVITSTYPFLSLRTFIRKTIEYALIYFIVVETIADKRRLRNILIIMLISAGMIGIDGYFQKFTGTDFLRARHLEAGRIRASFNMPNDFAAYLSLILPIGVSLSLFKFRRRVTKLLIILETLFLIILLVLVIARGAWVGFVVALLFIGLFKSKRVLISVLVALLILPLFLPSSIKERIKSIVTLTDVSSMDRKIMWQSAFNMFKARPILGQGLGTYMRNYEKYRITDNVAVPITYAHNCYLQMAAETGLVGLGVFIWLIVFLFIKSVRFLRKMEDKFHQAALLGLLAGLLAFLIDSGVDTNLYSLPLVMLFWFTLGITVGTTRIEDRTEHKIPS